MRRILRLMASILVLSLSIIGLAALTGSRAGDRTVPAGLRRNTSQYLTMRDSVRIAIDLWLPPRLQEGQRVPVVMNMTRYVRATSDGPLTYWFGRILRSPVGDPVVRAFNDAGYAVVKVDARGSGASEGSRTIEWSPDEVEDYGEVVDWVVAQPWSNGRVGAYGVSYEGNTAELLASTRRSAVRAVAPLYDDFDPALNIAFIGGVLNESFIREWSRTNEHLDRNDYCALARITPAQCRGMWMVFRGIKPVDADTGGRILADILQKRSNYPVLASLERLAGPRDTFPGTSLTMGDVSPFARQAIVDSAGTPMLVRVGWMDGGTVNVALSRFMTFRNPQHLEIGPWSHGGAYHTDPFLPDSTPSDPAPAEQLRQLITFLNGYLKTDATAPAPQRQIRYYTLNDGRWRTTTTWPPAGLQRTRWYLADSSTLGREPPAQGVDRYRVDTTASTGDSTTRWHTQLGGGDVRYPDRAAEDRRLLTYTSAPFAEDMEITGVPVMTLEVASSHADGGFFAYLENVAPDGRVTYITEGMLRALHRRESPAAPYVMFGPVRSYVSRDTMPLVPGQAATLRFELQATSVRIRAGHRLRLALAGADRPNMALYPRGTAPEWTVHRGASWIEVDMAPIADQKSP